MGNNAMITVCYIFKKYLYYALLCSPIIIINILQILVSKFASIELNI